MRKIGMVGWAVLAALAAAGGAAPARAWTPELTSWLLNTTGITGYGGLPANVQRIRYSASNVYIDCSSIPEYSIGPWPGNPNVPANKAFTLRFPRSPVENTGTKTSTPLGPIGAWTNGVAIFNALDAHSYNNQNIWHQNANVVEAVSFDECLGHPAPDGTYHHHQNATCVYNVVPGDPSPVVGYAFDGFPVYGPYAHANADGTGDVVRIRSSYRLRAITTRTTLPDGTVLTPSQYGPAVSAQYPLGYYIEDYEYVAGLGDLDSYNGRFAKTPAYPDGIYGYYVTIDSTGASAYPYSVGPSYYGVVATDDISAHGHVTIAESVTEFSTTGVTPKPSGATGVQLEPSRPNPAAARTTIPFSLATPGHVKLTVYDVAGRPVLPLIDGMRPAGAQSVAVDSARLGAGVFFYEMTAGGATVTQRLLVLR